MTVFDWALIVVFGLALFWGLKTGLIDALLTVVAVYVALLLSGQFAYRLVNFFTDSIESRAIATAIGYLVIFILVFIAARIAGKIIRGTMKLLMLGWLDRLGGLLFGAVAGLLLAVGITAVAARFAYDPETNLPIQAEVGQFRERLRGWMVDGRIPPIILDVRDAVPGNLLGVVPSDFARSLDALDAEIKATKGS